MNYYIEVTVLPDAEVSEGFIWQKLFQQVHLVLVDNKQGANQSPVGLGFPQYGKKPGFPLGSKLRLFAASKEQLVQLDLANWLAKLTDYLHIRSVQAVPENCDYVAFRRIRPKGQVRIEKDMQSKARLWAEKSGQSIDQCLQKLETTKPKANSKLPFVWLQSQTTKANGSQRFPLFIEKVAAEKGQSATFNCYGLSDSTGRVAVPSF